jgi:GTP-binding protein HflX
VLREIGADTVPSKLLLNKVDRLDAAARVALTAEFPEAILLSAKDPSDITALRQAIVAFFEATMVEGELLVPYAKQNLVPEVFEVARVTGEECDASGRRLKVLAHPAALARLESMLKR